MEDGNHHHKKITSPLRRYLGGLAERDTSSQQRFPAAIGAHGRIGNQPSDGALLPTFGNVPTN